MSLFKQNLYTEICQQGEALISGETDMIANMANLSALLWQQVPDINWAGFYIMRNGELVLGPFQGKPACIRIPVGKGVCGTAVQTGEAQLVEDVHAFPGHIACDAASSSEIVIPVFYQHQVIAVLDIDSPLAGRFDHDDLKGCKQLVKALQETLHGASV